jgi:hypothetical protein
MKAIKGTVRDGRIALSEPMRWPDGTEVFVRPVGEEFSIDDDYRLDVTDDEQADDPESITCWIAEFEAIPALEMTQAEEAQWQAARLAQKELDPIGLLRI